MSTRSKWLLLALLFLLTHTALMAAIAGGLAGGDYNTVFPFGSVDYNQASSIAKVEASLAFALLLGFAVSLLKDPD